MAAPRCPHCGMVAFLETQECADCGSSMGFHHPSLSMAVRTDLPKTAASIRTVSLPAPLAVCLAEHMTAFVGPEPDAPLFRTATGTLSARSNLNTTFRQALATAGAPQVRFHDLRHVAQVYAAEAGATLPELMARLGHATPAAALVYLHARSNRDHRLTAALSSAMEPSAPASAIAE